MSWAEFLGEAPARSIALDGIVSGGPRWDEQQLKANFDHHEGVVREATMSTSMQVFFAIKGGLMEIDDGVVVCRCPPSRKRVDNCSEIAVKLVGESEKPTVCPVGAHVNIDENFVTCRCAPSQEENRSLMPRTGGGMPRTGGGEFR